MLLLFLIRHLVQHFRRHVLRRATNALGPLYGRPNVVLGQAEVPQLHVPFRAQQDLFSIRVCLECTIRTQAHQKKDVSRIVKAQWLDLHHLNHSHQRTQLTFSGFMSR